MTYKFETSYNKNNCRQYMAVEYNVAIEDVSLAARAFAKTVEKFSGSIVATIDGFFVSITENQGAYVTYAT